MTEKKILVVDDEDMIRDLFEQAFTQKDYIVRLADSAEEALEVLKNESIMVVFMDLNLPGMSGIDLCRRLRKDNPIGIFYAITGYHDLFGLLECREAGFDDFFTKPVQLDVLFMAVEHAFNQLKRWQVEEYKLF